MNPQVIPNPKRQRGRITLKCRNNSTFLGEVESAMVSLSETDVRVSERLGWVRPNSGEFGYKSGAAKFWRIRLHLPEPYREVREVLNNQVNKEGQVENLSYASAP